MKKKGRVSGTIGWLLAVILCLGVIGYSTYLGVSGFMGAATGNAIVARFNDAEKQAGEANTKQLVKDAAAGFSSGTDGLTYNSYTLTYQMSTYQKADDANSSSNSTGIVYVNNDYTYVKATRDGVLNKEYTTVSTEMVYVKATGKMYYRENFVGETAEDSLLLDTAKWTETAPVENVTGDAQIALGLFSVVAADDVAMTFDVISGEYKFEKAVEGAEKETNSKYGFTVGYRPNLYAKVYTTDETTVISCALTFSNLNNTKVSVPQSLQDVINPSQEVTE